MARYPRSHGRWRSAGPGGPASRPAARSGIGRQALTAPQAGLLQDSQRDRAVRRGHVRLLEPVRLLGCLDAVVDVGDVIEPDGIAISVRHDGRSGRTAWL